MRSVLLSNIPHYHHLAEALHGAGYLQRYITSPALIGDQQAPRWLPAAARRKLEGRRLHNVPVSLVTQVQLPELLQRVLPRTRLISRERADWLNNNLFDRAARRLIENCNVLHFVSSVGLESARKAKAAGAVIICDVRQEHPEFQRRILREESGRFDIEPRITGSTYEARVLEEFALADWIIVPSSHAKRTYIEQGFPAERLFMLPYGVDLDHFQPAEKPDDCFRVIFAGSLTLRKGPQYLLEAFSKMDRRKAELVLVGPLDPAFRKVLARYEGSFRYAGVAPRIELSQLYSSSSVFVLPSLADSFSLATLEAMACGLPVIVSENTGAADAMEPGKQGFVVPIRDAATLQSHLSFLQRNEEARREMGGAAAARAREWTWARYGRRAVDCYKKISRATGELVTVN